MKTIIYLIIIIGILLLCTSCYSYQRCATYDGNYNQPYYIEFKGNKNQKNN